ncbi:MAG TPA: hypothetical protein ENI76_03370 [Ignavibacteria bacterium]|nr:hypothetical protein [Ignavibacteria bacterium]
MKFKSMKKNKFYLLNPVTIFIIIFIAIAPNIISQNKTLLNTAHLDHLYEKINVNGKSMGIIHIYSDFPNYNFVEAKGEGIACVDDAARAMIFYIRYYEIYPDKAVFDKIENLSNFLLYMQAKNGFFYNFIWKDYTIDSTYKTSVAEPNWWTWRAIWALSEAQKFFLEHNSITTHKIVTPLKRAVSVTLKWLALNRKMKYKNFGGFEIPAWLPQKYAADQAAILVKGLAVYYEITKDKRVKNEIKNLSDGIVKMQVGNSKQPPYYVFLSWRNSWHQWGNSQADALIDVSYLFHDRSYLKYADREVKYFYPYLLNNGFFNDFVLVNDNNNIVIKKLHKYSQIAYGIRPMVWASIGLYKMTKDTSAAIIAGKIASWLLGNNIAGTQMYSPKNGITFDGIISKNEINKNSGAESTIEALLTIIDVEQNPIAKKILWNYYNKHSAK